MEQPRLGVKRQPNRAGYGSMARRCRAAEVEAYHRRNGGIKDRSPPKRRYQRSRLTTLPDGLACGYLGREFEVSKKSGK
jgi:hypothetical protein